LWSVGHEPGKRLYSHSIWAQGGLSYQDPGTLAKRQKRPSVIAARREWWSVQLWAVLLASHDKQKVRFHCFDLVSIAIEVCPRGGGGRGRSKRNAAAARAKKRTRAVFRKPAEIEGRESIRTFKERPIPGLLFDPFATTKAHSGEVQSHRDSGTPRMVRGDPLEENRKSTCSIIEPATTIKLNCARMLEL
jgi:hypothetical protein